MLVFWDQRLVLLATPKTGTTSIETALESLATLNISRPPELKHASAQRYSRFLAPMFEKTAGAPFSSIALMREPLSWLGSWYRYRQREEMAGGARDTSQISFDAFVQAYVSPSRPAYADVGSQARFLMKQGEVVVDRLFCYEELETFLHFMEDRLNCQIVLPKMNVSPLAPMELEPATLARLHAVCADDFALYDRLRSGKL